MTSMNAVSADVTDASVEDYVALLKPRVMSLVVFTGLCGVLMAPGHIHPVLAFTAILCIAIGAGAAGCLNMWYERDIDALMQRTKNRPLPRHRLAPENALAFGVWLASGSVVVMGIGVRWQAAFWLAVTIAFYVFIYTVLLKPRTPQNIVIGGASGALPPLIGWVAVTGETSLEAWLLFAIIFMWTPPHFWALSLYKCDDYARANIPMLPVVQGQKATKVQILLYSVGMVVVTLLPQVIGMATSFYTTAAAVLGAGFVVLAGRVLMSQTKREAMQLFAYSILYLFVLFFVLTLDRVVLQ